MKPLFIVPLMLAAALSFATPAAAGDISVGNIIVERPWSRATPAGAKVGVAYLGLINIGSEADRLISASSAVAERVEIHSSSLSGGVMRMRRLSDGLALAPRAVVNLKPGGHHLMLIGLKQPLKKDQSFNVRLTFAKAGAVDVLFLTAGIGAASPYPADDDAGGGSASGSRSGAGTRGGTVN